MSIYVQYPPRSDTASFDDWLNKLFMRINDSLSFSVNKNAVDQSTASGVAEKVEFSTIEYDTSGGYSTTNNRWICQQSGIYEFIVQVTLSATLAAGQTYSLDIYKNGVLYKHTDIQNADIINPVLQLSAQPKLNKNDYIEVWVTQDIGTQDVLGAISKTFFYGKRIT